MTFPNYVQPLFLLGASLVMGISNPAIAQAHEEVSNFFSPGFHNKVSQSLGYGQGYEESKNKSPEEYFTQSELYLVYVDSNNSQTLQKVRQLEPNAYIRQFQGRYVIQAGVFGKYANAQERIRQLEAYRVSNTKIKNISIRQNVTNNDVISKVKEDFFRYYYVVIPSIPEDAINITNRLREDTGFYWGINTRNHGLGHHVAVGPFTQYSDARKWNKYLHNMGFSNARVYYGH